MRSLDMSESDGVRACAGVPHADDAVCATGADYVGEFVVVGEIG